jgi:hypothetical protein
MMLREWYENETRAGTATESIRRSMLAVSAGLMTMSTGLPTARLEEQPRKKSAAQPSMHVMPDDFAAAAEELRVLLALDSAPDVVDDLINLVERLPIALRKASKGDARTKAVMDVGIARIRYEIALKSVSARRANSRRDFLRQFRDLKNRPTRRRLLSILAKDTDEHDLKAAENAIRFAILQCGVFGDDVPPDWVERLGDSSDLLRKVAETVCDHFAYKVDRRGRPRNKPLEDFADRLAQIYGVLTGRAITYAKATDNSRDRNAGEPYGPGLDFMLTGLRLINSGSTSFQATTQIDRLRTARRENR